MKKIILASLFLSSASYANIDKVTIYNNLSEITDNEVINGEKMIELPSSVDGNSLQGTGNIESLSFVQIPEKEGTNPEVLALTKQKEDLALQIKIQDDQIKLAQETQKNLDAWLEALKNSKKDLPDPETINKKLNKVTNQALTQIRNAELKKEDIAKEITVIEQKLNQINTSTTDKYFAKVVGNGNVTISYNVFNSQWVPEYEFKLDSEKKKIFSTLKAKIDQKTGEDWNGVQLSLSSDFLNKQINPPNLNPWVLQFIQTYIAEASNNKKVASLALSPAPMNAMQNSLNGPTYLPTLVNNSIRNDISSVQDQVSVLKNNYNVFYKIDQKVNLKNGENINLKLGEAAIPVDIKIKAVPRQLNKAFILASFVQPQNYVWNGIKASIFLDDSYKGTTILQNQKDDEKAGVSFGQDNLILIKFNSGVKKEENGRGLDLQKYKIATQTYDMEVKNLHSFPVTIDLYDTLPVASDKDIEVKVDGDITDWDKDVEHVEGSYKKTVVLQPQETKKYHYQVSVKYPNDKQINW